eukprot:18702-Rhodomonas_salina.2
MKVLYPSSEVIMDRAAIGCSPGRWGGKQGEGNRKRETGRGKQGEGEGEGEGERERKGVNFQ